MSGVAGCCHISVCIAGANTTGQRAVSSALVSRSSAQPVRGACQQVGGGRRDEHEVGLLAEAHVRDLGDGVEDVGVHRLPDRAAQVGAPTNCSAAAVGHDRDVVARLGEQPQQLAGLVGGDAAGDAEDDAGPSRCAACGQCESGGSASSRLDASEVSRPPLISRSAIDSGFSCTWVSTSGPTYSSRPSPSWE